MLIQASQSQHFSGDQTKATALQNMMKLVRDIDLHLLISKS